MTKLSPTQAALLQAAAAAEYGAIAAPVEAHRAAAGLTKRGLLTCEPQPDGPNWLVVTPAGRAAIVPDVDKVAAAERMALEGAAEAAPGSSPEPRKATSALTVPPVKRRASPTRQAAPSPLPAEPAIESPAAPKGKIAVLLGLLRQPGGASVSAMMTATGWQAHSVRGAMSGAIKKGVGLQVISEKTDAGRLYRIAPTAPAASEV